MTFTTSAGNKSFLPSEIGDLVVQPVSRMSIALHAGTEVQVGATANDFRVPVVTADPTAAWTAEGAEITESESTLAEEITSFYKLAGLSVVSRELANDSSPAAGQVVGDGLARDIARKLDAAFFGTAGVSTLQPQGLGDITPNAIDPGTAWANMDPFTQAQYEAEGEGAQLNSFVANPADALILAQLKETSGSNRDLLQPDATRPSVRTIGGVPLLVSSAVAVGTVWGIPKDRIIIPIREDVTLDIDRSAYFSSDRVGIRAIFRVGTVYPHATAVQKITLSAA